MAFAVRVACRYQGCPSQGQAKGRQCLSPSGVVGLRLSKRRQPAREADAAPRAGFQAVGRVAVSAGKRKSLVLYAEDTHVYLGLPVPERTKQAP